MKRPWRKGSSISVLYSDWSTRVAVFSGTAITHSQGPEIPDVETALADPARPVLVLCEPGLHSNSITTFKTPCKSPSHTNGVGISFSRGPVSPSLDFSPPIPSTDLTSSVPQLPWLSSPAPRQTLSVIPVAFEPHSRFQTMADDLRSQLGIDADGPDEGSDEPQATSSTTIRRAVSLPQP